MVTFCNTCDKFGTSDCWLADTTRKHSIACIKYVPKHIECGGCGRFYPERFPECPFCYVEPFLQSEADDAFECPTCGGTFGDE